MVCTISRNYKKIKRKGAKTQRRKVLLLRMEHVKIILPESDDDLLALCDVETYRASGPGGQHVNCTDSAVRLIYRPYNIVVTCKEDRSQYFNKMRCLQKLREKVERWNYRPPKRIPTRISVRKKNEGLARKKKHGEKKHLRKKVIQED